MLAIINDVDVRKGQRIVTATIEGARYEIPEMWMMGYCRTHEGGALAAVQAWHEQATLAAETQDAGPKTSAAHVDVILQTSGKGIQPTIERLYGAAQSKAIRDLFRQLGWAKYFRVTKGCWSLGPSIEWAKGFQPTWYCDRIQALRESRGGATQWFEIGHCTCADCKHRDAQRDAIRRRVYYVLNEAFKTGREFGDRSDSMTDYFDADYTFHP